MLYDVPNPALARFALAASAPFSSRTRNALAIFLAFAVPAHRDLVVVGALGGLFWRRDFKEGRGEERREGRKGVVASAVWNVYVYMCFCMRRVRSRSPRA